MGPRADTSNSNRTVAGTFDKALKTQLHHLGLIDTWRHSNPTVRDYTFFSHSYRTYSRIDYIFLSQSLLPSILQTHLHLICLSDLAPLELTLDWPNPRPKHARWYFSNFLCRDRLLRDELRHKKKQYFELNEPELTSHATTWDAFKAVIRGKCIELATTLKTQQREECLLLATELRSSETAHKTSPSAPALRKVTSLKGKLQAIYTNKAEKTILRLQAGSYTGETKWYPYLHVN